MFYLDFWYFFLSFYCEVKLYIKNAQQAGMFLETFILRFQ